jgi:dipeptidyl-peptidase-4
MSPLAPFELTAPEFVAVKARDGVELDALMIKPRDFRADRRYPTVCSVYGGPGAPVAVNRWAPRDYLWHQLLAQHGFLVWICDPRSATASDSNARFACRHDLGASELRDLEDSVEWLVQEGYADPARIAAWGWSYGGFQTLYCLTHSKRWKAGIAVNPVTDWRLYDTIYTERYMGLPQANPDGYRRASVVDAAKELSGSLLLVHAAMDENVHMQNSLQLAHALQMAGKQFQLMIYPRVRHEIESLEQQVHLFRMMLEFLQNRL